MNTVFHIGFQRTASTWLKANVFSKIPVFYGNDDEECSNLFYGYILSKNFLEYNKKHAITGFKKIIKNKKTFLFSEESMVGKLLEPDIVSAKEILQRLSDLGKVKIIIFVRNQITIIWSLYKQYLKLGGYCDIHDFLYKEKASRYLDYLKYDLYLDYCHKLFGKKNVYVECYENLITNPTLAIKNMVYFIDKDIRGNIEIDKRPINRGYSPKVFSSLRALNRKSETRKNPCGEKDFDIFNYETCREMLNRYSLSLMENKPKKISSEVVAYCCRYKKFNNKLKNICDIERYRYPL